MRIHHAAEHDVFGKLLGLRFHHHHRIVRARDDEVEIAGFDLLEARIQDIFAVLIADARRSDRTHERNTGDGESGGSGDHRQHVGSFSPS
jgi:hypothetical protein